VFASILGDVAVGCKRLSHRQVRRQWTVSCLRGNVADPMLSSPGIPFAVLLSLEFQFAQLPSGAYFYRAEPNVMILSAETEWELEGRHSVGFHGIPSQSNSTMHVSAINTDLSRRGVPSPRGLEGPKGQLARKQLVAQNCTWNRSARMETTSTSRWCG
jgi:hypothetical protein